MFVPIGPLAVLSACSHFHRATATVGKAGIQDKERTFWQSRNIASSRRSRAAKGISEQNKYPGSPVSRTGKDPKGIQPSVLQDRTNSRRHTSPQ